jgi:predicted HicB family RNase H-like nuclease
MASKSISRRPSEQQVSQILGEAGRDPDRSDGEQWHVMNLRMPQSMKRDVDATRKRRTGKVSRNQWILEAIEDKLEREGGDTA